MGNLTSKPPAPPPLVDLLPPRFSSPLPEHQLDAQSPLSTELGAQHRRRLSTEHFSPPGVTLQANLRPEAAGSTLLSVGLSHSAASASPSPPFFVSLSSSAPLLPAVAQARGTLQLNSSGDIAATVSAVDIRARPSGTLPPTALHATLRQRGGAPPWPYSTQDPSPPAAALPPPSALEAEVGGRFSSASSAWTAGGALGAGAPFPLRLYAMGQYGGAGRLTGGVEVSGGLEAYIAAALGARGPAAVAPSSAAAAAALASAAPPLPAAPAPLALAAGLSFNSEHPAYELCLGVDSARGEAVAGYTHSLVIRRSVWNPLEPAHVKGIYQYVDLGMEARRALAPPFSSALSLMGAWQWNRHVLFKARLGSAGSALSCALRSWTDPCLTLCCTASGGWSSSSNSNNGSRGAGGVWELFTGSNAALGLSITLNQGGGSEYTQARELGAQQAPTPTLVMPARPELNSAREARSLK